ncbi:ATP-grasp domain-containing protein [Vibrio litoralis]|uniref:ATP-grasp domain-containing protein n=1 Tax=Vibrio litoralis TaxID=335972 RepID=UPI00040D43C5|nr:hypothetical protein [Vibrio litoralis]
MIYIHKDDSSFSVKWIEYCEVNSVNYRLINCYSTDVSKTINCGDVLLWHFHHNDYSATKFAKSLMHSLSIKGVKTFPSFNMSWHFDDKIAQKYLLESISAPLINTYVFYKKEDALRWAHDRDEFPLVFKLAGGAGASNVKLLKNNNETVKYINRMFSKGVPKQPVREKIVDSILNFKKKPSIKASFNVFKNICKIFIRQGVNKDFSNEKGYFYVQDFIPNLDCDYRIIVINGKAFAIKRMIRSNDFRASGSGNIVYDIKEDLSEPLRLAFDICHRLKFDCCAFDFVFDGSGWKIIEISYGFTSKVYEPCLGYWDDSLTWHSGSFIPENFMISNLV